MMLGEIDFDNIYFTAGQNITMKITKNANGNLDENNWTAKGEGQIEDVLDSNPLSITAHIMILLFVFTVSMVIMNLLVGLAVSDIQVSYS